MTSSFMERQIESMVGDKAARIMRHINRLAAKQGGETAIENYRLLGKRAFVVLCVAFATVQIATSAVGFVISRKSEEQRVERIVRRVLEEERQEEQVAK